MWKRRELVVLKDPKQHFDPLWFTHLIFCVLLNYVAQTQTQHRYGNDTNNTLTPKKNLKCAYKIEVSCPIYIRYDATPICASQICIQHDVTPICALQMCIQHDGTPHLKWLCYLTLAPLKRCFVELYLICDEGVVISFLFFSCWTSNFVKTCLMKSEGPAFTFSPNQTCLNTGFAKYLSYC